MRLRIYTFLCLMALNMIMFIFYDAFCGKYVGAFMAGLILTGTLIGDKGYRIRRILRVI